MRFALANAQERARLPLSREEWSNQMQNGMTPQEMLESIRAIFAQEMKRKPAHRSKPVNDPALWRAIENQEKHSSEAQCYLRGIPGRR
jgi:hypothetical protein